MPEHLADHGNRCALSQREAGCDVPKVMEGKLRRRGRQWGEVKTGAGSIRDVEFVTQYLQQANGKVHPEVHSRNTLDGLARLRTCGILPANEYGILAEGYTFLRSTENHLQIMH